MTCCRCLVVVDRVVVVNEVLNVESLAVDVDLFSDDLTVHVRRQLAVENADESRTILKLIFKRVQENQISVLKNKFVFFKELNMGLNDDINSSKTESFNRRGEYI